MYVYPSSSLLSDNGTAAVAEPVVIQSDQQVMPPVSNPSIHPCRIPGGSGRPMTDRLAGLEPRSERRLVPPGWGWGG